MVRIAALQFAAGPDASENLATCLRLVEAAVREHGAGLVVLPEFSNHPPVRDDGGRAREVAARWDGPFLTGLREACGRHGIHLVVGVSLLSDGDAITSSALLIGPSGALLARADRQMLPPELARFHAPGARDLEVAETSLGRLGMCVGRDAATMETARLLALSGAQLVCACFGPESARDISIHVAARAAENRLFVVAASAPPASEAPDAAWQADCSQIVAPDGTVKALAPALGACSIAAEVDLQEADCKQRADGTHVLALRRPELYRPLLAGFGSRADPRASIARGDAEERPFRPIDVALLSNVDAGSVEGAIESAACFVRDLAAQGAVLIGLPELFCFERGLVDDAPAAARWFGSAVRRLAEACAGHPTHVVTSLVEETGSGLRHMGVVIGHAGVVARAPQLHVPQRHAWAQAAGRLQVVPLPWGKLGLLVGEDAIVPEAVRCAVLLGADVLAVPGAAGEPWETAVGLMAIAIENGVGVVAAMRETENGGGMIIDPMRRDRPLRAAKEQALLVSALSRPADRRLLQERPQRIASALTAPA
jgi:predicted amidohydrolase